MQIGDTFLLLDRHIDEHLWLVISEPQQDAESVVIVNLTSYFNDADNGKDKDSSCILDVGDHPSITHRTCVSYWDAKCVSESLLDSLVAKGSLIEKQAASDDLLAKVMAGAEVTGRMPNKCRKVLIDQGLIDS